MLFLYHFKPFCLRDFSTSEFNNYTTIKARKFIIINKKVSSQQVGWLPSSCLILKNSHQRDAAKQLCPWISAKTQKLRLPIKTILRCSFKISRFLGVTKILSSKLKNPCHVIWSGFFLFSWLESETQKLHSVNFWSNRPKLQKVISFLWWSFLERSSW